jgi:hypothetical protein
LLRDDAHSWPSWLAQGVTDSVFQLYGYPGPAKLLALTTRPRKASADSFLNHGALKLGEDAHHLKHRLAGGCRRVEALLVQKEIDAHRVKLREEAHKVLQAAAEAIDRPGHDNVELPPSGIPAERVELRAFLASLGTG